MRPAKMIFLVKTNIFAIFPIFEDKKNAINELKIYLMIGVKISVDIGFWSPFTSIILTKIGISERPTGRSEIPKYTKHYPNQIRDWGTFTFLARVQPGSIVWYVSSFVRQSSFIIIIVSHNHCQQIMLLMHNDER